MPDVLSENTKIPIGPTVRAVAFFVSLAIGGTVGVLSIKHDISRRAENIDSAITQIKDAVVTREDINDWAWEFARRNKGLDVPYLTRKKQLDPPIAAHP